MTIDELSELVSKLPDQKVAPGVRTVRQLMESLALIERRGVVVDDPRAAMFDPLARRLMQAERYGEALAVFADPSIRQQAPAIGRMLEQAETRKGKRRAETLFKAAKLAREDGMELLAFESNPDWTAHQSRYARPSYIKKISGYTFGEYETKVWVPAEDAHWIADSESRRIAESRSQSTARFTYRLTTAELANQSAHAWPVNTQAFSAVLCYATSWLLAREPELAHKYYKHYRDEGKQQTSAKSFGR